MSDHAIVIGIQRYPGIEDLHGPCHDATAVRDWLVGPGGLDPAHVQLVRTSDYPDSDPDDDARPILNDLLKLFRPHVERTALGGHEDGRLFLYVAGHGFADPQQLDAAGLFTANARFFDPLHLAVTAYAEWFHRNWAFDELVVVMDCCRSTNPFQTVASAMLPRTNGHARAPEVRTFYAFATGWGQLAREREIDGQHRGIFTAAFLDALEHAAPDPQGRVTGSLVKNYIHNAIGGFAGEVAIDPPDIRVDTAREVVFARRAAPAGMEVAFEPPSGRAGAPFVITNGAFAEVHRQPLPAARFTVPLLPGLYKARVGDDPAGRLFEVPAHDAVLL